MSLPTQFEGTIQREALDSPETCLAEQSTHIDPLAAQRDIDPRHDRTDAHISDQSVLVAPHLTEDQLKGFELNPVVDGRVKDIGEICLKSVRQTRGRRVAEALRSHRLYTLELAGFRHAVEITDPAHGSSAYTILSFPGFSENIEGPFRQEMHEQLSWQFPQARIVSIGSNGIGTSGDRYGWNERSLHGLNGMATQRLSIARALAGDQPVFTKGTSMGSVISQRFAHENSYGNPVDGAVNLQGNLWLSPALVDLEHISDMGIKFPINMGVDVAKELFLKTSPMAALRIALRARKYGLSAADLRPMSHQALELLCGTPESMVDEVIAAVPTIIVAGETDPLAQWPMVRRLEQRHPDNLDVHMIKGRGHGLGMKPGKACAKIARASHELVEQALQRGTITNSGLQIV